MFGVSRIHIFIASFDVYKKILKYHNSPRYEHYYVGHVFPCARESSLPGRVSKIDLRKVPTATSIKLILISGKQTSLGPR